MHVSLPPSTAPRMTSTQANVDKPLPSPPSGGRRFLANLRRILPQGQRGQQPEKSNVSRVRRKPVPPVLSVKQERRQTYVMHTPSSSSNPHPTPILTLSSHHLVVIDADRRELARPSRPPSYPLASIPEYASTSEESYTSSSSYASSSSASLSNFCDPNMSPRSYFSDDSSDEDVVEVGIVEEGEEEDEGMGGCTCADTTLRQSTVGAGGLTLPQTCPSCAAAQDFPEDEGAISSDSDSFIDRYGGHENEDLHGERWSDIYTTSSSACSSATHDPLFSPRSSSTSCASSAPSYIAVKPANTDYDLQDVDFYITSAPPSPTGQRFRRSSLEGRGKASSKRRSSTLTV